MSNELAELFGVREDDLAHDDLRFAWRAAYDEETDAYLAWCQGTGAYAAFVAAVDREQAAAYALQLTRRP